MSPRTYQIDRNKRILRTCGDGPFAIREHARQIGKNLAHEARFSLDTTQGRDKLRELMKARYSNY